MDVGLNNCSIFFFSPFSECVTLSWCVSYIVLYCGVTGVTGWFNNLIWQASMDIEGRSWLLKDCVCVAFCKSVAVWVVHCKTRVEVAFTYCWNHMWHAASPTWMFHFMSHGRHIQDPASQRLTWNKPPVNVLVIRKIRDDSLLEPFKELCRFLVEVKYSLCFKTFQTCECISIEMHLTWPHSL